MHQGHQDLRVRNGVLKYASRCHLGAPTRRRLGTTDGGKCGMLGIAESQADDEGEAVDNLLRDEQGKDMDLDSASEGYGRTQGE
jgi:hypothetical protein